MQQMKVLRGAGFDGYECSIHPSSEAGGWLSFANLKGALMNEVKPKTPKNFIVNQSLTL